jgi:hypothetical protein
MQRIPLLFALLFTVFSIQLSAQVNAKDYRLAIEKISEKIVIDGVLDEPEWNRAQVAKDFFMITPVDTGRARQHSEARVAFDDEYLYISVIFYNNAVKGPYVVESFKRDFSFGKNDNLLIAIDPFDNQTTGFSFGLNAYGAQWDGTMFEGKGVDLNWDTKWYSEVRFDEDKWVGEMAIPFKSIRYDETIKEWGINFGRLDLKASEKSSWAPVPRQFPSVSLAFAGRLVWDTPPPKQGVNASIIPYVSSISEGTHLTEDDSKAKVGADLKYTLTTALNLDVTLNPDFSQAEVDQQVTNLDRFELFFPERRQFFLENADLFSNFGYRTIRPFFSRRIGLNVPIVAGARLSGNLDENWRVGLMNIQTKADELQGLGAENYGVVSLQRKVQERSNINFLLVNKEAPNTDPSVSERYHRNAGVEYNYFSENNQYNGKIMALRSINPDPSKTGTVIASHLEHQSIRWIWRVQQEYVSNTFSADVGFVPRTNYHKYEGSLGHLVYTASKTNPLLSHGPSYTRTYFFDLDWHKADQIDILSYIFNFQDRSRFILAGARSAIDLLSDFDPLRNGIGVLKAGTNHEWTNLRLSYDSKPQNLFTYSLDAIIGGYYGKGKRNAFIGEFGYRVQPILELSSVINYNQFDLPKPWKEQSFWLVGLKANLTLTDNLFFSNLYQYNEQVDLWNFNSRLQWRYKPASDIFLVFNSNEVTIPTFSSGWNLTFKINYWLNL